MYLLMADPMDNRSSKIIREAVILILIDIFPVFLVILAIPDIVHVIESNNEFFFGSNADPLSVCSSKIKYVSFRSAQVGLLLGLVGFSFLRKRFRTVFYMMLVLNLILFICSVFVTWS